MSWQPSASLDTLKARARLLREARAFLHQRGALEVETPMLSRFAATDPHIDSVSLSVDGEEHFLHTSPEFPMKRLLAAGSGDLFQIAKVFRAEEQGQRHAIEFTLLEWYRLGWDDEQLMHEVEELLLSLARPYTSSLHAQYISYQQAFLRYAGFDPLSVSTEDCAQLAAERGLSVQGVLTRDDWLDWFMSSLVQPALPSDALTFITDYPASQAALARLRSGNEAVAARFEVFWGDLELANGFHELTDAAQQRSRFEQDNRQRKAQGKRSYPQDERLLQALESGMPNCAGVAVGLDRLLMATLGLAHISEAQSFDYARA